jgi:putative ABC transport system permease protein
MFAWFQSAVRNLLFRHRRDEELDAEVHACAEILADEKIRGGMSAAEACRTSRMDLGGVEQVKEQVREARAGAWLDSLFNDIRYAARLLRKSPAFTAVAVLTLALGIGANTAIFSVVDAAILRPIPYPAPNRLVILWGNVKRVRVERRGASYPDYRDWCDRSRSFTAMAAFDDNRFALTGIDTPELIPGEYVSPAYFPLLGIKAEIGRTFLPGESQVAQRDAVAILSDGTWKRRFGADPGIIGRTIQLDGRSYTIVGVAPPEFRGLSDQAEVWVPFTMPGSAEVLNERGSRWFEVLARLKPGVSLAQAQSEMNTISANLARTYPDTNEARGVEVATLEQEMFGSLQTPLLLLLGAVGFVLLVAATNVANLLLARSEGRQHEIAMRTALGAGRGRLLRQLVTESAVLVGLGCAAGLALAHYGIRALVAVSPLQFPSFVHPTIDVGVGLFTALVCAIVALALGLAPTAQVNAVAFDDALRHSALRSTGGRRGSRFQSALVVAEIAISLLLLVGAGLMIRTLRHIAAIKPGYDPSHVVHVRVALPQLQPAKAAAADVNLAAPADTKVVIAAGDILNRISSLPSVESTSLSSDAPLGDSHAVFYTAEGQPPADAHSRPRAYIHFVSRDFFRTLHTRFLAGRPFSADEIAQGPRGVIVTRNLVQRFWPDQNPIGKRVKGGGADSTMPWIPIVGVVEEMKYRGLPHNPTADPDIFLPFNTRSRDFSVMVRTSLPPEDMLSAIRSSLREVDPAILIYDTRTIEQRISEETAGSRFTGWLMMIFAGVALALAMIGVYGVMSYSVSKRTREIGVRMALGASRRDVLGLVVGRGMALILLGIILGTAAAVALTRLMTTIVYGVSASDPFTFAAAAALLAAVAILACLLPASRASRIDPATALRSE